MTKPIIDYVRAPDCFKSPDNVRTTSDAEADRELKAKWLCPVVLCVIACRSMTSTPESQSV